MKKALILLIAAIAIAISASAQSPIRWRTSINMISPDEGEIVIKALIEDGWHLYGFNMPDGGPKPTRFDFSESCGIELNGEIRPSENPIVKMDPLFGRDLSWWDRNVNFTQRFSVVNKNDAIVRISITFMSCNGGTCTPPRTESISATIPQYDPSRLTPHKK